MQCLPKTSKIVLLHHPGNIMAAYSQSSSHEPIQNEMAFSLRFLKKSHSFDENSADWLWQPKNLIPLNMQTATFSGKNKADDYTNE
jgi:hypothetical protein